MNHVDLTRKTIGVPDDVQRAAKAVFEAGGSPRAQMDAARAVADKPVRYMPHFGAKQRARVLRQMEKAAK